MATTPAAGTTPAARAAGTTTPATTGTTEGPSRTGLSVRARLTATVALLVAIALAGAGAILYTIEARVLEAGIYDAIDQEFSEFQQFLAPANRPAVQGTPDERLTALLDDFLTGNVPDDRETLVGWVDGAPQLALAGSEVEQWNDELDTDQVFLDAAASVAQAGGSTQVDHPEYGELVVAGQPVREGRASGALIVVYYLDLEKSQLRETMGTYALVGLFSLMLITLLAARQSGRLLAPLRTLRETTDEITETDLARRLPEVGNDDITALTRTLNGMLARLEAAFHDQRRFLDDAGHELKTPLTIVRGHLELLDDDDPAELARTRELLLDEVDRMARLVSDLTLLAKQDRPDFLDPGPVLLEELTETLLAKARGLGDREWVLDASGTGVAQLDEQRVTQAVLQLAQNAVRHTRPGELVAVGSSVDGDGLQIWVRDVGPGVPADERGRIFERFTRARPGTPDDEGFGLGLSIVRAIAQAHGGSVTVTDAEPRGALFTIHLPQEQPWPAS